MLADKRQILRDDLNITHRRIPILAIGSECFFDTGLILTELDKRSKNGKTLQDHPLAKLSETWTEEQIFPCMVKQLVSFSYFCLLHFK